MGEGLTSNEILRLTPQNDNICHCEDERSEDVAIAKSLSINEITTQSTIARNDNIRHPEFVSVVGLFFKPNNEISYFSKISYI